MPDEPLLPELLSALRRLHQQQPLVRTLSNGKPNWIDSVDAAGVRIETEQSRAKGSGPQLVPARMLNAAWRHLRASGSLTNRYLLAADGLNVKRSSAVCALLAVLPGVKVTSTRPIRLQLVD